MSVDAQEKSLYRNMPRKRDPWPWIAVAVGLSATFFLALRDLFSAALILGMTLYTFWWSRRPIPPVLHFAGDRLEMREGAHPYRLHPVSLEGLERVVVAGPKHDRRFFFYYPGRGPAEVRPFYPAELTERALAFLREVLPGHVPVEVKPLPSFMEEVRGNYP